MILEEAPSRELYELTEEITKEAGLPAYEISNYARSEDQCLHNLLYWRGNNYIGIGPGAHGRITKKGKPYGTFCYKAPETWLENVEKKGHGLQDIFSLTSYEKLQEMTLMGLRLTEGMEIKRLHEKTGLSVEEAYGQQPLVQLEEEGLLKRTKTHLIPTFEGRLRLNSVIAFLLQNSKKES